MGQCVVGIKEAQAAPLSLCPVPKRTCEVWSLQEEGGQRLYWLQVKGNSSHSDSSGSFAL